MIKKIVFPVLTLLWMGLIFYFSSQTGIESGGLSGRIVNFIIHLFYGDNISADRLEYLTNIWSIIIRKGAHFTIFGILGILTYLSIWSYRASDWDFLGGILFTFFYAAFDEFHQSFVGGRAGMFTDVLIDTAGSIFFLGIIYLITLIIRKRKKRYS